MYDNSIGAAIPASEAYGKRQDIMANHAKVVIIS
jgi:hypothetical protein